MTRFLLLVALVLALIPVAAFSLQTSSPPATAPASQPAPRVLNQPVTTSSGLVYHFTQLGNGPKPQTGDTLVIHGIGRFTDGKEFWNTRTENKPYEYRLGVDRVIRGFSEGMLLVQQGDRIVITMKPGLAYGNRARTDIPANSTLVFDYEILAIKPNPPATAPATAPR